MKKITTIHVNPFKVDHPLAYRKKNKIPKAQIIYEPRNQFTVKELIKLAGIKRSSLFKKGDKYKLFH